MNNFICSDLNSDLINLWKCIKQKPQDLFKGYSALHQGLLECANIDEKSIYYKNIRDRFNRDKNPIDFYFINRTSYNGLIRYNSKGEYNTSFHLKRNGADEEKIKETIYYYSNILIKYDVSFICQPYNSVTPNINDLLYLDPPYEKSSSMYFNNFENADFLDWLSNINCPYFLSYDGKTDKLNKNIIIDRHLYDIHIYLKSGLSSFSQLKHNAVQVEESLYIKNVDASYIDKQLKTNNVPKKLF